jgi:DNA invertase Pin-like site-specific DNA recombinase
LLVRTVGQNEAGQRAEIERWLTGNRMDPTTVTWYVDKGKSGDNLKRPAFEQLQAAIFAGEVGTVVVYKLDRSAGVYGTASTCCVTGAIRDCG